ncbi:hypothetical protein Q4I32_001225 [Leishmania shawi]|uniref:Uncharacterized protein n=1 Tax=Leishmania shawi TaxID=5680 RepID=A0AAW3C5W2_9TRYP
MERPERFTATGGGGLVPGRRCVGATCDREQPCAIYEGQIASVATSTMGAAARRPAERGQVEFGAGGGARMTGSADCRNVCVKHCPVRRD